MKILAFDIGGTAIKYALTDENCTVNEVEEIPSQAQQGGAHVIELVMSIIARFEGIDAVGISTAGQVDGDVGKIIYANDNIPGYTGMDVAGIISARFNVPVFVENDANCAMLAEAKFGAAKDCSNFLCLTYGTGIGGGIYLNDRIYHGVALSAGEFGHIITHPDGRRCGCGGRGCYEAYASCSALVRAVEDIIGRSTNAREIFEPQNFEMPEYRVCIDYWINEIVTGLVSLIHIFNPTRIVLGGGVMNEKYVIKEVKRRLMHKIMPKFSDVEIKNAELGNRAGVCGAAYNVVCRIKKAED